MACSNIPMTPTFKINVFVHMNSWPFLEHLFDIKWRLSEAEAAQTLSHRVARVSLMIRKFFVQCDLSLSTIAC